jgi:hypothetical protein
VEAVVVIWLRIVSVLGYLAGFIFAWLCWTAAKEPATAIGWLGAASVAFWVGRIASRLAAKRP